MTKYSKGEWTNARYDICEIECDGEVYCTVATKDVELIIDVLNENEQLKSTIKGQELEIVRLHHLADAMSGVLRELDIYDVYNQEQIMKVKEKLQ